MVHVETRRRYRRSLIVGLLLCWWLAGASLASRASAQVAAGPDGSPTPPPRGAVAIVGGGGAVLWDAPDGAPLTNLIVGARLSADARLAGGEWISVQTTAGERGWVEANRLLAVGLEQLPVGEATVPVAATVAAERENPVARALVRIGGAVLQQGGASMPGEPLTPGTRLAVLARSTDGERYYVDDRAGRQGWTAAADLIVLNGENLPVQAMETAVSAPPAPPGASLRPEPEGGRVTVTVITGPARLNLRAGPGTDHVILGKAQDGDTLTASGRTAASDWIRVDLPTENGEAAWVAADYVSSDQTLEELPVTE